MASLDGSLKVHELCRVAPPPTAMGLSLPLTFFDLFWLRLHPVERLFFFSVPHLQSSSFFDTIVPKLKRSLSLTLQYFLPLAGNIVWPSDSPKPIVQYSPGDAVSLAIAVSDSDFNNLLDHSPRETMQSRPFVPNLDSSASVISLQITLFPNSGFCIGSASHHACLDGKSSVMFMKAWAYLCQTDGERESSCSLPQELEPFLTRETITDPCGLEISYINGWSKVDHIHTNQISLKILSETFSPIIDRTARATFVLKGEDLNKINERVLQKWENHESTLSKPQTLSAFVLTAAYVLVCIAKAMERTEKKTKKMYLGIPVDCRNRLEHLIPENYFGNGVMPHLIELQPQEHTNENGVIIAAKKIHEKIRKIRKENGVLDGAEKVLSSYFSLASQRDEIQCVGIAGSPRFGIYQTDFGWGKPEKVEITSGDRGTTIAMAESKDGNDGVEVGFVLNKHVMDQFAFLFQTEIGSI